ncbi:MAG: hypothetical protein MJK04_07730 [Psychrosphaera sp.]|nr:hypothetical protein [Psychrosphaera sp.]
MNPLIVPNDVIKRLLDQPEQQLDLQLCGLSATLKVAIPRYDEQLKQFYGSNILPDFTKAIYRSGIPNHSKHFGLIIRFHQSAVLNIHDEHLAFYGNAKTLIKHFETVIIYNACVDEKSRDIGHRNRFPHLKFHRDRNESQPTPYSLFTRDPHDSEQSKPRDSSTLFVTNLVAYLQCMKEHDYAQIDSKGLRAHYDIFKQEDMTQVLAKVALEHRWDEPEGIGEISMLDNRNTLHSSYFRQALKHGYRIGVRYLK